jgi:tetratricopeptide (TPR) repeat protein
MKAQAAKLAMGSHFRFPAFLSVGLLRRIGRPAVQGLSDQEFWRAFFVKQGKSRQAGRQPDLSNLLQEGMTRHQHGMLDQAERCYEAILTQRPGHAEAQHLLGVLRTQQGRYDEAAALIGAALAAHPASVPALTNMGNVLGQLGRRDEAQACFSKALGIKPDHVKALVGRGNLLRELERPEAAVASYEKALAIQPDHADAACNLGRAFQDLNRLEEALASYDRALAIRPDHAEAAFSKSLCLLLSGRFDEGWLLYESRKQLPEYAPHFALRSFQQRIWTGETSLSGKTVFIYWEQGLGDTIQFCRFAKMLEQRGAKVIFSAQDRLRRLLQTLSPTITVIGEQQIPVDCDYHSPLLSLPLALKMKLDGIPCDAPYMRAEPERILKWRDRLGGGDFKIGVAWQGAKNKAQPGRSFALPELRGVSQIPGVRLISLQKSEPARDLPPGMHVESLGEDFDADGAFLDTAAVMETVDLVISCDTSTAHVAGALGRPVWVALKHAPDWRWRLHRDDSPWYPAMRLFRQPAGGDWKGVFLEIEKELMKLTRANGR